MKTFTSKRYERPTYTFDLDGQTYTATPGKSAEVQLFILGGAGDHDLPGRLRSTNGMINWLLKSISPSHIQDKGFEVAHLEPVEGCKACEVVVRLIDNDDPLEMDTLMDVANWLIEEVGKRPTMS